MTHTHTHLVVDFDRPELCAACDPVECYVRGEALPFRSNWRDLLVSLLSRLIDEQNPGLREFNRAGSILANAPFFKESKADCGDYDARILPNGRWIIVHYSIPTLIKIIDKICKICGILRSEIKMTYRPKSAAPSNSSSPAPAANVSQTPSRSQTSSAFSAPVGTDAGELIVDFAQPEKCADCDPVACYFRGEALAFGQSWADVLAAVIERFIGRPRVAELYLFSLNGKDGVPFFRTSKPSPSLTSRRLSNGAWIIADDNAPSLLPILQAFLEFCRVPLSDLKITYRPKTNSTFSQPNVGKERKTDAPQTPASKVSAPARKSNAAFPSVARKALQTDYANGFRFNESTLRLFAEKIGFALDDATVAQMKKAMFCRDDLYFLPETVADPETASALTATVADWLDRFEIFELSRLYERFESRLNVAAIRNVDDFESYVKFVVSDVSPIRFFTYWQKTRFARIGGRDGKHKPEVVFPALFKRLKNFVDEAGGTLDEYALTDVFPAYTFDSLSRVAKEFGEELVVTAINDVACVQTFDALGLPDDFESALTETLDELDALDLTPTEDALHVALSLRFGFNFNVQYNLTEAKTYRRLIELNYTGATPRRWKGGVFGKISEADE